MSFLISDVTCCLFPLTAYVLSGDSLFKFLVIVALNLELFFKKIL